jgi:hypothetical protein
MTRLATRMRHSAVRARAPRRPGARVALAATVTALASVFATTAGAAAPQQTVIPIDDTFTVTGICPFPILEHGEGTLRIIDFVDQEGNLVRELGLLPGFRVSFSANGTTLTTVSPSVSHITFNEDSATFTITGLSGHISIPGEGTVALDAGRLVVTFTDDQEPELIAENGTFSFGFGDLPPIEEQLCAVLA